MNKNVIRFIALLLCGVLLLGLVATVFASEEESVLTIGSAEEFLTFAENCRLDAYSIGLQVSLTADIDLTDTDFSGVPIFCGTFLGNGHTISGLNITDKGSYVGLFRYLTETATVSDLHVTGAITPSGSRSYAGGIAGSNAGTIHNCRFTGSLAGADCIGGIVGVNELTGVVDSCSSGGNIHGDHFVGGIAGENKGKIHSCANSAAVNTTEVQNSIDIEDISVDSITGAESSVTITDIGGIAGMNSGTVADCVNNGAVGYQYMGYNIGGIAGTNTGYVVRCTNYSRIYGRKEVGGIVGQLEPYATLIFSTDTVQILQAQVDDLSTLVSRATGNTKENFDNIKALVTKIENHVANIERAVEELEQLTSDPQIHSIEDAIETVETMANLITSIGENITGIDTTIEDLYAAIKDTTGTLESDLEAVSKQVDVISSTLDNASENLGGTVKDISDSDTEAQTDSEVADCVNYGEILGDLNVGGIVGAISIENDLDPEEDLDIFGAATLNYDAEVRSVITNCVNTAQVHGRKYQIGGIVGWMSLGLTKNSANSGTVTADGADHVGGIVGLSAGCVRSSSAKCQISGDTYVGGIAGLADTVSDCLSVIQITAGNEKLGGIIGCAEERDEVENNFYLVIGSDVGGIDGISYSGVAESAPLESLHGLPESFLNVKLQFVIDDEVSEVTVPLGDSLTEDDIPTIPLRDGCIGVWDGLDEQNLEHIYFDAVFEVCYDSVITAIEGDLLSGDKAVLMAQGQFTSGENLMVEETSVENAVAAWKFDFPNGGVVEGLRLLRPEDWEADKLVLMVASDNGDDREVAFTEKGGYLVFSVSEGDNLVYLMEKEADYTLLYIIIIAACAVAVIITVIVIVRKARRKKRK